MLFIMKFKIKPIPENEVEFTCNELEMLIRMTKCDQSYACTNWDDWEDLFRECLNICRKLKELYERFCKETKEEE